jgi:hypothetical protein
LYSLKQTIKYWECLKHDLKEYGNKDTLNVTERCVFILGNLGLSISQLLGQNNPKPTRDVPSPQKIFSAFVDEHGLDLELKSRFDRFNYFYNGCRHFGLTKSGKGYYKIDQLTLPVMQECYEFGLELWKIVISVFQKDPENDLDEFRLAHLELE